MITAQGLGRIHSVHTAESEYMTSNICNKYKKLEIKFGNNQRYSHVPLCENKELQHALMKTKWMRRMMMSQGKTVKHGQKT